MKRWLRSPTSLRAGACRQTTTDTSDEYEFSRPGDNPCGKESSTNQGSTHFHGLENDPDADGVEGGDEKEPRQEKPQCAVGSEVFSFAPKDPQGKQAAGIKKKDLQAGKGDKCQRGDIPLGGGICGTQVTGDPLNDRQRCKRSRQKMEREVGEPHAKHERSEGGR